MMNSKEKIMKKKAKAKKAKTNGKANRMSVLQIRKRLELQMELDRAELNQVQNALPCLESLKQVEQARTRIHFCESLLKDISVNRPSSNWK